ncbi:hypothetical protein Tco_1423441 [Tanacetum coccineum]
MNALKALQPPTTLLAAIPRFEENSGQSFSSVGVEKEGKDIGFLGALMDMVGKTYHKQQTDNMLKNLNLEDISTCIGSPESINNQESRITIGEGDQSRVPEKNAPSHVLRKQQLGGLIFDAKVEIPVGRNWNIVFQHFELLDDRHAKRALQRKVCDPGLAPGITGGFKKMEQFRIDQLEANLERFKIDQAAINSEAAKQWAFLQATIEKNKVEADRQFAEIMNALKALQPPTTLPATIPHFEENRRQSFSGKEVKDNCFKGAHVTEVADECGGKNLPLTDSTFKDLDTEDICTCVGVLESANSQDSTNPTWAGDQSRIREKDVPSHGPRKRHLGGQIFGLELIIGLHCDPGRGEDRVTWNPGINYHPSERKWNFCLNSFIESNIMNNHVFQHFRPDDRHERRAVKRRVWDPGITGGEC